MECPKCHSTSAPKATHCAGCGAELRPDPSGTEAIPPSIANLAVGSIFAGRYRITQEIGRGGMGVVYGAEDLRLKRAVALKLLPWWLTGEGSAKERFIHEAQAASALDHTNICTIYEVDETSDGQMFIAMALCEGQTLARMIERGPMRIEDSLDIAIQVCDGLAAAHAVGVTHRDIKPANIMVKEGGRVRIVDFGLAKLTGQTHLTAAGTVMGTVDYMSPEQARGDEVDSRADIWAVGVVLYEMLTGRAPFRGENQQAIIHSILHSKPEPVTHLRTGVPPELSKVIERCLKRDPAERFQTAADVRGELRLIRGVTEPAGIAGSLGSARRLVGWAAAHLRADPRKAILVAGVVVLAVVLTAVLPPGRPLLTLQSARPWVRLWIGPQAVPADRYVAVLPFEAGGDTPDRALCDGIVDATIGKVAHMAGLGDSLWVASSERVRDGSIKTPRQARERLGTNLALAGSVTSSGGLITLRAYLIDTKTLRHLRTFDISDPIANLSTWQDDLVVGIAGLFEIDPEPRRLSALRAGCTSVPEAFSWYLRGRGYLSPSVGKPQADSAISAFDKAIAEDSSFARACVGMGEAYLRKFDDAKANEAGWLDKASIWAGRATGVKDSMPSAFELAGRVEFWMRRYDEAVQAFARAVELDSIYSSAYNWLGYVYVNQRKYDRAIAALETAAKLRPRDFSGYVNLGAAYFYLNLWEEAKRAFEKSLLSPTVKAASKALAASDLGTIYFHEGRYADGEANYRKAMELKPDDYQILGNYADDCYWIPGKRDTARIMFGEAAQMAESTLAGSPDDAAVLANLASYYSMIEDRSKAEDYLLRAVRQDPSNFFTCYRIAETYEQIGQRAAALIWLERALAQGYPADLVERYPGWRNARNDERFGKIIAKRY